MASSFLNCQEGCIDIPDLFSPSLCSSLHTQLYFFFKVSRSSCCFPAIIHLRCPTCLPLKFFCLPVPLVRVLNKAWYQQSHPSTLQYPLLISAGLKTAPVHFSPCFWVISSRTAVLFPPCHRHEQEWQKSPRGCFNSFVFKEALNLPLRNIKPFHSELYRQGIWTMGVATAVCKLPSSPAGRFRRSGAHVDYSVSVALGSSCHSSLIGDIDKTSVQLPNHKK